MKTSVSYKRELTVPLSDLRLVREKPARSKLVGTSCY